MMNTKTENATLGAIYSSHLEMTVNGHNIKMNFMTSIDNAPINEIKILMLRCVSKYDTLKIAQLS